MFILEWMLSIIAVFTHNGFFINSFNMFIWQCCFSRADTKGKYRAESDKWGWGLEHKAQYQQNDAKGSSDNIKHIKKSL